ncbi:MAG: ABC transporter permease subunit [Planctomycetota bacterium]|nr:ABC transporter permease subunit [Planctomycetota bacterium]
MRVSREVKGYAAASALFFIVLEVLLVLAVIWWPAFEENSDALKSFAGPLTILVDQIGLIERVGVHGYVIGQHFFKACNTLGVAAAVLLAMGAIAGEVHRGTLELWLARPLPRWRLYTERFLLGWFAIAIPVLLSTATANLLLATVDDHLDQGALMVCGLHECLFLGMIYAITFFFSAVGSQPLKIGFIMLFAGTFEFAIYMISEVTYFSVFRLVDIQTYVTMMRYGADWPKVAILVVATAIPFTAGLVAFQRRVP